ncbi:uncharacterized protein LOC141923009 [Strix aluco]|uniref:uncharacterized protein LOC141923009 n=1 Tax=Strix aluco TaxID=111821 RepID=UPI003DA38B74
MGVQDGGAGACDHPGGWTRVVGIGVAPRLPSPQPTPSRLVLHVWQGCGCKWQEQAVSGSSPGLLVIGLCHRCCCCTAWVGFSQILALAHSPGEKWEVSGVPSLFLLPLPLQVRSPREPLLKALLRGWEELPVPGRQQGLQGSSSGGSLGRAMLQGALTAPHLSLCQDRQTEEPQPHWEPPVPDRPMWGAEPQEEAGLPALRMMLPPALGDSPACTHPALPIRRHCRDFAAPARLWLQGQLLLVLASRTF